jgi:hypothetical protein
MSASHAQVAPTLRDLWPKSDDIVRGKTGLTIGSMEGVLESSKDRGMYDVTRAHFWANPTAIVAK